MICRLCLVNINADSSGISLFKANDINGETLMVKIIAKYLHLLLTQNDSISTTICQKCCSQLDAFHKFCSYVEEQQSSLRNTSRNINKLSAVKPEVQFNITTLKQPENTESGGRSSEYVLSDVSPPPSHQKSVEAELKCEPEEQHNIFVETLGMSSTDGRPVHPSNPAFFSTDMIEDFTSLDYDAYRNFLIRQSNKIDSSADSHGGDVVTSGKKQRIPLPLSSSFLPTRIPTMSEHFYVPSIESNNFYEGNGFSNILFSRIFFRVIKQLDTTAFQQKRGGALVQCCFCDCKLKGSTQVTSNLIRHLKIKHPEAFVEYKRLKAVNCK